MKLFLSCARTVKHFVTTALGSAYLISSDGMASWPRLSNSCAYCKGMKGIIASKAIKEAAHA